MRCMTSCLQRHVDLKHYVNTIFPVLDSSTLNSPGDNQRPKRRITVRASCISSDRQARRVRQVIPDALAILPSEYPQHFQRSTTITREHSRIVPIATKRMAEETPKSPADAPDASTPIPQIDNIHSITDLPPPEPVLPPNAALSEPNLDTEMPEAAVRFQMPSPTPFPLDPFINQPSLSSPHSPR